MVAYKRALEKGTGAKADIGAMAKEVIMNVATELVMRMAHQDDGKIFVRLQDKVESMLSLN